MGQRSRTRRQSKGRPGPAVAPAPATPQRQIVSATGPTAVPGITDDDAAALVVTHAFDPGPAGGDPFDAVIRVSGRRRDVSGVRMKADAFTVTETVRGVVPGSGPVATTSWIYHLTPGEWEVEAEIVSPPSLRRQTPDVRLSPTRWSWRARKLVPANVPARTRWAALAPLAATPAVIPGSFTLLAVLGILAAVAVQPLFLAHEGLDVGAGVVASIVGLVVGLIGAKAWYMVLKGPSLESLRQGWSVDGFLVGAPLAAIVVALVQGVPVTAYLDGITPGIFVAVAIGRVGCFLTGCCAGRVTAGRGIWSSDRRVAAKRVPTQLLESGIGLVLAIASTVLVLGDVAARSGLVFLAAMAVYVAARQGLLRLRAEARPFSWRRAPGIAS